MEPLYSSTWAWVSWILIGVVGGLLAGTFLPGKRYVAVDVIIGLLGAIIGGWLSAIAIGDHTPQAFAISDLVALFAAGAILWIYNRVLILLNK